MADTNTVVETKADDKSADAEVKGAGNDDLQVVNKQLEEAKAELAKNQELLQKVRKFEKENKAAAEQALKEQGKYKELFEETQTKLSSLEQRLKDKVLTDVLSSQLQEAGAKSISTVLKLVDKSQIVYDDQMEVDVSSVKSIVDQLRKSDPVLFGDTDSSKTETKEKIDVKRATDSSVVSGYEKEIKLARNQKEIQTILRKYGKIS